MGIIDIKAQEKKSHTSFPLNYYSFKNRFKMEGKKYFDNTFKIKLIHLNSNNEII